METWFLVCWNINVLRTVVIALVLLSSKDKNFDLYFSNSLIDNSLIFIPPATKLGGGGILESPCPSVRLSVCLSVCLSVRLSVDARLGKMDSSA